METLNNFYKKYEGLIKLLIMVLPLVFASWKYIGTYMEVPSRMDAFEARAKRDSIHYSRVIKENRMLDSIQNLYLENDYLEIEKLKKKLP
jgi:hypothetical protein